MSNKYELLGFYMGFLLVFIPLTFFIIRRKYRQQGKSFSWKKFIIYLIVVVIIGVIFYITNQSKNNQPSPISQINTQTNMTMPNTSTSPSYKDFATSNDTISFDNSNGFYVQYSVNGKPVTAITTSGQGDGYAVLNLPSTNTTIKAPLGWLAFSDAFQIDHLMSPKQDGEIEFSLASLKDMGNVSSLTEAKLYILNQYQTMQKNGATVQNFDNADGSFSVMVFGGKINGKPQTISQTFFPILNNPDSVSVMTANYPPEQSDNYLNLLGLIIDNQQIH
jgi:hypothetical protein